MSIYIYLYIYSFPHIFLVTRVVSVSMCSSKPAGSSRSLLSLLRYTDLAIARRDLESSQLGAAWKHFSKCRPLSKKSPEIA